MAVALAALVAPCALAHAENEPSEPDPLTLVVDGLQGAAIAQTGERRCPDLAGGTAGLPQDDKPRAFEEGLVAPLPAPPAAPVPAALPRRVDLRTLSATFNRRYAFALLRGHMYVRPTASTTWAPLPTPACFDGDVHAISVDDDELLAEDTARHVFTMDGALGPQSLFNWTERWGPPFWTGAGRQLPDGAIWSWSVLSPGEDRTFRDPAGNDHPVGDAKVSHVWMLRDAGRRLVYMDPWLPADESYEMCGPERGRFKAIALSAAASTVFIMNRFGDLWTRMYDFDMSGPDSVFDTYSYDDQRGKGPGAPIQLPPEAWRHQPKIPGRIRDVISIDKTGPGNDNRRLRVAGAGGFWEKMLTAPSWHFVRTGQTLGRPATNTRRDMSRRDLAPSLDRVYSGGGIAVPSFDLACSPALMTVDVGGGRRIALTLHTTDTIRQTPRGPGLDGQPRLLNGMIQADPRLLASRDPAIAAWVAKWLTGPFTSAPIDATSGALVFRNQGWTLFH